MYVCMCIYDDVLRVCICELLPEFWLMHHLTWHDNSVSYWDDNSKASDFVHT